MLGKYKLTTLTTCNCLTISDYVSAIREVMFSQSAKDRLKILEKYQAKILDPLDRQFDDRVSKAEAVCRKDERNKLRTDLFPAGIRNYMYFD